MASSSAPNAMATGGVDNSAYRNGSQIDLALLQSASRVVRDQFLKDSQAVPDLGETLSAPSSSSYSVYQDDFRVPFQKRKLIGIPEGLFQYYNSASITSHMGIMAEIDRVWITIDHKLFLWDYIEGQDISSFIDQPDVITHVALVKPKPSVFVDDISHLLVICTPLSVLLLGLSYTEVPMYENQRRKQISLYATDMSIASDIEMGSVVGTQDGRIFMKGVSDGNLYELHYQQTESWFGKRVQLVNHSISGVSSLLPRFTSSSSDDHIVSLVSDTQRHIVYSLTSRNIINVYQPTSEKTLSHVQTLSNILKTAQDRVPGSNALTPNNFTIISIHPIEPAESRSGHQLVAVTSQGVRLYFAQLAAPSPYQMSTSSGASLRLVHVRLPPTSLTHPEESVSLYRSAGVYGSAPSQQGSSRPYTIKSLESSCYLHGLTIAAQQGDDDGADFLLCMAPDLSKIGNFGQIATAQRNPPQPTATSSYTVSAPPTRPPLTEHAALLAIPGRTWASAAMPRPRVSPPDPSNPVVTNELSHQFSEPPYQILILTNVGLTFLIKRRALDYLRAVIEEVQSDGNIQPILEFRDSFGRDQTCAMLLGLACGNTFLETMDNSPIGKISSVSPDIIALAKQAFYDFGERPIWTERVTYGSSEVQGTATYSGRREGLALYFARLLRPLWTVRLTKPDEYGTQQSSISDEVVVNIQKNLLALGNFLETNPHLFHSSPGDATSSRSSARNDQEAWTAEQSSVMHLRALLTRSVEAVSFFLLLVDYNLGSLISRCDPEIQKMISALTFEGLVTSQNGVLASRALVNVIIDQQIGQQISVDNISEVLQQRCGSFCSADDVMLYKGKENIKKAVETKNLVDRGGYLAESLRLFLKGARILEFEKVQEICGDYQNLGYAKGAVELPLACAKVLDPDDGGLEHWQEGLAANDPRSQFSQQRLHCYDLVLQSLAAFEERCTATVQSGGSVVDEAQSVRVAAYEIAFSSDDEMFHSTLYDWLISRGVADELLDIRPPFLEAHLCRDPVKVENYQLLWQFYVKDGQSLRAAEVLANLAESSEFPLNLDSRIEYLTLAVGNAKSHPIANGGRHETAIAFLTDLEDKLDVARVQLEIYHALLAGGHDKGSGADHVTLLPTKLFTMSELYIEYAEPFHLLTMQLLCLHVSEHGDENVVRRIWNEIFEECIETSIDPAASADLISSEVVPLGQRFFPSEAAFPLRHIASLLVQFALSNQGDIPSGWAPRTLVQCHIPYNEIWDVLHDMYESQVPPFNQQANVQAISSDMATLLSDWLQAAQRPQPSSSSRIDFPVGRVDSAIDQYLSELEPSRKETKAAYEGIKRQLRLNW
ncbi:nucleoporin [Pterulicium gracile]|uniref:Nucleoporin n=1 Tax=Pterulicium gracile TaxID=1884261 RepID=A0A5C3QXN8_9AGAR|nr:nucleoporin [Pterula gracilis]